MTKQELKNLLEYHNNLYYNESHQEISDAEYDALKDQYLALGGEDFIGGGTMSGIRYKHSQRILSLDKVTDRDTLVKELKRLWPVVVEPKIDGLTAIRYPDGKAATRGNGEEGNLIPNADGVVAMGRPMPIRTPEPVRMEVLMTNAQFKKLKEIEPDLANPRNAASGILNSKDGKNIEYLTYRAHGIVGSKLSASEQHVKMMEWGFYPTEILFDSVAAGDAENLADMIIEFDKDSLPYAIDGLVIKSDQPNAEEKFGATGHHPRHSIAWKWPGQGAWTTLKNVTWQTGRTGRLTPVAELEPVFVDGSTISRATLHNIAYIEGLGLKYGSEVFVQKANDVIPAITQAKPDTGKDEIVLPSECPECGAEIDEQCLQGDLLYCPNELCGTRAVMQTVHLAKRDALDIRGLSEETILKMYEAGVIKQPFDIFELTKNQLLVLPGFADKSTQNLYDSIQAAKNPELDKFLYAAGLPEIGRSACRDIAEALGSWNKVLEDVMEGCPQISAIEGIGPKMVAVIRKNYRQWIELHKHIVPKEKAVEKKGGSGAVKTFVITGTLSKPRHEIEGMILRAGHKTSGSVSKNVILVAGESPGSKLVKAKSIGVKIVSEAELDSELTNG